MKPKALTVIVVILSLGAMTQIFWLWSLPSTLLTTSVEYRRGYFVFDLLLGSANILQGINFLLGNTKTPTTRIAGLFAVAIGLFCILIGVSIAYRHMV